LHRIRKEVEVKLPVASRAAVLRRLVELGAKSAAPRVHEMNTLFDTADGDLARRGQMVRIRVESPISRRRKAAYSEMGGVVTLTYKGPVEPGRRRAQRYKVREEYEVRVASAEPMEQILQGMGLRPWFRYEKYRQPFRLPKLPGVVVDLDETPAGDFLELEGTPAAINRGARLLGYAPADYIVRSYAGLYWHSLHLRRGGISQNEPTPKSGLPDMLFSRPR